MRNITKLLTLVVLCLVGMQGNAQNVTISPQTGKLIAALTSGNEEGFAKGWSSLWRHEQLPISFSVSDESDLTLGGEIANPAGNINVYNGNLVVAGGTESHLYCVLSLPKGYKITAYKMVLLNNLNSKSDIQGLETGSVTKRMYETDNTFNTGSYKARTNSMSGTDSNDEFVIERNNIDANQLYFILNGGNSSSFYAVTIKSFEVWFSAEGTFNANINNDNGRGVARSVVTSQFTTSKIDIGAVQRRTKDGKTYFAYSYENVRDLPAYNWIYQENAVIDGEGNQKHNGKPEEGDETKTIYPVTVNNQNLLAFGNNTYYAESPVEVKTLSGLTAPMGYRIVGAVFTPIAGVKTSQGSVTIPSGYKISFRYNYTTYYLTMNGSSLSVSTNDDNNIWQYDSETGGLYYGSGDDKRYLSCEGDDESTRALSTSAVPPSSDPNDPGYYDLILFEHDGNTYIGWDSDNPDNRWYLRMWREQTGGSWMNPTYTTYASVSKGNTNNAVNVAIGESQTVPLPTFDPGSYTLEVYGTDKDTPAQTVPINGSTEPVELNNLNNDAVKFKISGLAEGKMALLSVTLKLQFLNPYIDNMDIVCHDPSDQFTLTQTFTANDFRVAGGSFTFYVPTSKKDKLLNISFSDLYSKYGDDTYDHVPNTNPGNSRYNFVKSQHYDAFTSDNIYNNTTEAASDTHESVRIAVKNAQGEVVGENVRTKVSKAGNIRFKFNNAEDLTNTSTNTGVKYLEETPFTLANYIGSDDPDGSTTKGNFIDCQLKANSTTQNSGTYYVFTTDETRYNIAPTTAWQHRYYAFYRMEIELEADDFEAMVTPTKVYNNTFTDTEDQDDPNPMWGVKFVTNKKINVDDGNGGTKQTYGYLTTTQVYNSIASLENSTDAIKANQVLYVDCSELLSVPELGEKKMQDILKDFGKNILVYLPLNTTSTENNVAFMTKSGSFRAGGNIVLTDKQPFFAPYDIQVDDANYATYTRLITTPKYGQVQNATLMLPFGLSIDGTGKHTNEDGSGTFTINELKAAQDKVEPQGSDVDYGISYFGPITPNDEGQSEANVPYMVKVDEDSFESIEGENFSFVATQKGAKIAKTPAANFVQRLEGVKTMGDVTFINEATYSGKTYPRTANVFYFAKNMFLNIHTLVDYKPTLYVYPFRSVYTYEGNLANKLNWLEISYDEDVADGIKPMSMPANADLMIRSGNGMLEMEALRGQTVTVRSLAGTTVNTVSLNAGDSKTINLPSGVYIVNNVKIIVK